MRVTNILDRTADAALWANGRVVGIEVSPDGQTVWALTSKKVDTFRPDPGSALLRVSTNGGVSFGPIQVLLDPPAVGDAIEGACLLFDPRFNRLHAFHNTTIGLANGQNSYNNKAPIAWQYSDGMGAPNTWSPAQYISTGYGTNSVGALDGLYDPANGGRLAVPCAAKRIVGVTHSPFALVTQPGVNPSSPSDWSASALIAPDTDQGESRWIADGGYWWALCRNEVGLPRRLYRGPAGGGAFSTGTTTPWERMLNVYPITQRGFNLGFCTATINGETIWFYASAVVQERQYTWPLNGGLGAARRAGAIWASRDQGRSYQRLLNVTSDRGPIANSFFGYSSMRYAANKLFLCYETNNYAGANLLTVDVSEFTATALVAAR